jgi:hypothetical protein
MHHNRLYIEVAHSSHKTLGCSVFASLSKYQGLKRISFYLAHLHGCKFNMPHIDLQSSQIERMNRRLEHILDHLESRKSCLGNRLKCIALDHLGLGKYKAGIFDSNQDHRRNE